MYFFLKDLFNYWVNFFFKKLCKILAFYILFFLDKVICIKDREFYENVLKCKCWYLFLGKSFFLICLIINKVKLIFVIDRYYKINIVFLYF